jgi:hypothetical protein
MNWLSDKVVVSQDNNNSYLFVVIFRGVVHIHLKAICKWVQLLGKII